MIRFLCFLLLLIGSSFSAFAQSSAPAPTPTPPSDDSGVVKIATDLIQLDVTVTDKSGKIVTDLGPADFEVFENGEKQNISNLIFINRTSGGASVGGDGTNQNDPRNAQDGTSVGSMRRTFAIVVDDLNLSFESVYYTRKALVKFVNTQMEDGDLVAIIRTGVGVGALQQFTSDKRLLLAAIDRIRWNPLGAAGISSLASVGQNPQDITDRFKGESDGISGANDSSGRRNTLLRESVADKRANDRDFSRQSVDLESGFYAQTTLATIRYIIGGINDLPGRKVMMLFSDGLAISPGAARSRSSLVYAMLKDLVDFANRSSVVVYTFDTKGLQSMSIQASDSTYEVVDGHRQQKERERLDSFRSSQEGLALLAEETGGKSLLNSNDLNYGIRRVLDEQTGYYLIGYIPDSESFDPAKRRFNQLEVKVHRPGLRVRYRSGFFNSPTDNSAASPTLSAEREMAKALTSPFARNDIALNINALYADDPKDGPYIRSFLHIDPRSLTFTDDEDGWKKATFAVSAITFGDNGAPGDNIDSEYTIRSKGLTYETMLEKGFVYVLIMPLRTSGFLQYRVAVRDVASGKIGSASQVIEVPSPKKKTLTVSSLAVENVSVSTWESITRGKVGDGPSELMLQSTLPYDTVLKRFPAGSVLRYGYEVYDTKLDRAGVPRLESQIRVLQNDKLIVSGAVMRSDPSAQGDPKRVQVSGAVMLKDDLPPGDYVLQVIVNDMIAKKTAFQLFPFEVIAK